MVSEGSNETKLKSTTAKNTFFLKGSNLRIFENCVLNLRKCFCLNRSLNFTKSYDLDILVAMKLLSGITNLFSAALFLSFLHNLTNGTISS